MRARAWDNRPKNDYSDSSYETHINRATDEEAIDDAKRLIDELIEEEEGGGDHDDRHNSDTV